MTSDEHAEQKKRAAERAVEEVRDGMVLGLGTGSTATFALEAIGRRIKEGLKVEGIPTSKKTAELAQRLGIPLTDFDQHEHIDLTIDGADQVERGTLNLVKGLGGALLREKIVASASRRMLVIVDESKLVDRLGKETPLPVEILDFGLPNTVHHLRQLGLEPKLRENGVGLFQTDGGNRIADCHIREIRDASDLQAQIAVIPGVVATGLFVGLASSVIVATKEGVQQLDRKGQTNLRRE